MWGVGPPNLWPLYSCAIFIYSDCFQYLRVCVRDSGPKTLGVLWWGSEQILAETPQIKGKHRHEPSPVCVLIASSVHPIPCPGSRPQIQIKAVCSPLCWMSNEVRCHQGEGKIHNLYRNYMKAHTNIIHWHFCFNNLITTDITKLNVQPKSAVWNTRYLVCFSKGTILWRTAGRGVTERVDPYGSPPTVWHAMWPSN